ncbi:MAG: ArsR/SmtB family transcription factor [Mycoplasma sp.]
MQDLNKISECFKVLSNETRVAILKELKNHSRCGCDMLVLFNITQPTFSYHMKLLVDCELVNFERIGVCNHYSLNEPKINELASYFKNLLT